MLRRWSFPPSRVLDAMLVIFAINGVLVASSLVARYATADDPPSQSTSVDETPSLSTNQAVDQLPDEIPPPPEITVPDEALLESLKQDSQFQEFVEIAAEQYPEYLGQGPLADDTNRAESTAAESIAAESGNVVGSDKLRDMEEKLLVVADLNQAALRLARIAHRHAAAERVTHSQQALQLSQQLQEMSAQLLSGKRDAE